MLFVSHGKSDRGKIRAENEDAFLCENASGVFAVADGLGGLSAGREASRIAITNVIQSAGDKSLEAMESLEVIFERAHAAVQELSDRQDFSNGSGTTLSVALADPETGKAYFGHIGDSAAYLLRDGKFQKLTIDHTQAEEIRRRFPEKPVPEAAEHTLTRCLGQPGRVRPDFFSLNLQPGDKFVLCTDGVTRPVSPDELGEWLAKSETPQDLVNKTIETVLERGAPDNATLIAVFIR